MTLTPVVRFSIITIKRILSECADLVAVRKKYSEEKLLQLLFRNVNSEKSFSSWERLVCSIKINMRCIVVKLLRYVFAESCNFYVKSFHCVQTSVAKLVSNHAGVIMCNLFFKHFIGYLSKPEKITNCQLSFTASSQSHHLSTSLTFSRCTHLPRQLRSSADTRTLRIPLVKSQTFLWLCSKAMEFSPVWHPSLSVHPCLQNGVKYHLHKQYYYNWL